MARLEPIASGDCYSLDDAAGTKLDTSETKAESEELIITKPAAGDSGARKPSSALLKGSECYEDVNDRDFHATTDEDTTSGTCIICGDPMLRPVESVYLYTEKLVVCPERREIRCQSGHR